MKKFLRTAAASVLACLVLATAAAAYTPVGNVSVPKATPTIDGTIKDGEYPKSGHIVLNAENMSAEGWLGEVTASVDLYAAWDKDNFYLAGKVHDSTFCYTDNAEGYNGDAFQVSLNIDNIFKSSEYDRAIFYSWGLQADGTISVMRQESANNGLIENAGKGQKTEDGWEFEVALPLATMSDDAYQKANQDAIVEPGMPIGGLFCYLDHTEEGGGVANAFGTFTDPTAPDWGPDGHAITFVFADEVVEETEAETVVAEEAAAETTAEAADTVVAPKTFDAAIIAAVAAIVSAAGYAVAKKH